MGWVKESVAASEKILDTDYENLENPDFQSGNTDVEFIERMEAN